MNIKTLKGKMLLGFAVMIIIIAGVAGWLGQKIILLSKVKVQF